MNIVIPILLLITFAILVVYVYKGGNLIVGFFALSILWGILGGLTPTQIVEDVVNAGIKSYGETIIIIILGAWFGRVMVETGIIGSIIKKTIELGGDKPVITASLLTVVIALIFTSAYGVGIVISIGLIALPIMISTGIPKGLAGAIFTMAHSAAMLVNIVIYNQYAVYFPNVTYQQHVSKAVIFMIVQVVVTLIMIFIMVPKAKRQHNWAAQAPTQPAGEQKVPFYAFISPLIPVLFAIIFNWPASPAIIVGLLVALLLTGRFTRHRKGTLELVLKALRDGTAEVAMLIATMLSIVIFSKAAGKCASLIGGLLGGIIPQNLLVLAIVIGVLSPLALFRGPLMFNGVGAALLAIVISLNIFPDQFTLFAFLLPSAAMAYAACPTCSQCTWTINFVKEDAKDHLKAAVPWCWISVVISFVILAFMFK